MAPVTDMPKGSGALMLRRDFDASRCLNRRTARLAGHRIVRWRRDLLHVLQIAETGDQTPGTGILWSVESRVTGLGRRKIRRKMYLPYPHTPDEFKAVMRDRRRLFPGTLYPICPAKFEQSPQLRALSSRWFLC